MRQDELSEKQRREEAAFRSFLVEMAWHEHGNSQLLEDGFAVSPEGRGSLETSSASLGLQLHLSESVVVLSVEGEAGSGPVSIGMHYGENIAPILDWVRRHQESISMENLAGPVKEVLRLCDDVVMRGPDGELYQLDLEESDSTP